METQQKYIIGFITLLVLMSGVIYITFENVKIRVDDDKSTFYVLNDNNRFIVAGREYNSIFDGTSKLNRDKSTIEVHQEVINNSIKITRKTGYIRGPVIIDTYMFNGSNKDIELFPISHTIEIFNATRLFYRYEVRDLIYDGPSFKLNTNSMSFGLNMKVIWQEGYRWARVYKDGILKVQYDIDSNYVKFENRLFDPPLTLDDGLVQYYTSDNSLADYFGVNNMTNNGTVNSTTAGFINEGWDFNTGNTYLQVPVEAQTDWTLNFWVKENNSANNIILSRGGEGTQYIQYRTTGAYDFYFGSSNVVSISGIKDSYTMITVTMNSGGFAVIYANGSQVDTQTYGGNYNLAAENYIWGRYRTDALYWQGYSDELAIWNRTLNSTEVLSLFTKQVAGTQPPFTSVEPTNTAPNKPTLNSPSDTSTGQALSVDLNVTVTDDDDDIMNVSFWNNATLTQISTTQTSIINGSTTQVTWSGLSVNTTYYWFANVTDGNLTNTSDVWSFTTSYTPTLEAYDTTPDNPTIYDNLLFNITCSDIDSGDTITGYVQVYNGTSALGSVQSSVVSNNTNTLLYTLNSGNTSTGQTWTGEYWCGDGISNSSKSNDSVSIPVDISLSLEGFERNITAELGSIINITSVGAGTICIDVDHPQGGINVTCGTSPLQYDLNVTYFQKTEFNDSETSKDIVGVSTLTNETIGIIINKYDELQNISIGLNGSSGNSMTIDTLNTVSSTGTISFFDNSYDGDFSTAAFTLAPGSGIDTTSFLYFNHTPIDEDYDFNITFKYRLLMSSSVPQQVQYLIACINTSGDDVLIFSDSSTVNIDKTATLTKSLPDECKDGYNEVQIVQFLRGRHNGAGNAIAFAYETSVDYLNVKPNNVSFYINGTKDVTIPGRINNSELIISQLNDKDRDLYFLEAKQLFKTINLYNGSNVTVANITIEGVNNIGTILGTIKLQPSATGIYVNETGDYYYEIRGTSSRIKYNLTTGSIIGLITLDNTPYDNYGGIAQSGETVFGSSITFFTSNDVDELGVDRYYLESDNGPSNYIYGSNLIFNPGDVDILNSTHGITNRISTQTGFYIFELTDLSSWSSVISFTGTDGFDNSYGIAKGDNDNEIFSLRRYDNDDNYKVSLYNITGEYQGFEISIDSTQTPNPIALDYQDNKFYVLDENGIVSIYSRNNIKPSDVTIDIGNDGIIEYTGSGNITEIEIDLNITSFNNYINNSCSDTCIIPIVISSSTGGTLNILNLNIRQSVESIMLNLDLINNKITTDGDNNVPINVESLYGNLTLNNLKINYRGGNDTIEVKAHTPDYSTNLSRNITYYYSGWNWSLPNNINYVEFIPQRITSKDVSPYGQRSTTPIFNITALNYGGKDFNYSIYMNDSSTCVNLSASETNSVNNETQLVNGTWKSLSSLNYTLNDNFGIWMFADYGCDRNSWGLFNPQLTIRMCCIDCDVCDTTVNEE